MAFVGTQRYIYFYVLNGSTPITGLVKSSFSIIFTRNNSTSSDILSVTEIGSGRYWAGYIPSTTGTDYLEIDYATYSIKVINVEVIYSTSDYTGGSSVVTINNNYPTSNALSVTERPHPNLYTLYIFMYSDWQIGNQSTSYAVGQTALNTDGSWVDSINVIPGAYTIVISNGSTTVVIAQNLTVT